MKNKTILVKLTLSLVTMCFMVLSSFNIYAKGKSSLSTKWYLHYESSEDQNRFHVGRSYLTFKTSPTDWFHPRMSLDAHQDDSGDWKVRLKYLHAKFKLGDYLFLNNMALEVGIAHTPWLDFEEHINLYRMKDKMTIERCGIMNSADLGGTVSGLFGGLGSFAFGIYNGGGYHAKEKNNNKVFQSRLTLEPISGLKISHFHINGKGNKESSPKWRTDDVMLSLESEFLVVTGQYFFGEGNQKGNFGRYKGYGTFVELKHNQWSLLGRHDWFNHRGEANKRYWLGGLAYRFLKNNVLLVTYDRDTNSDDWKVMLTAQVVTKHGF